MYALDLDGLDGVLVSRIPAPMLLDDDLDEEVLDIIIDTPAAAPAAVTPLAGPTRAVLFIAPSAPEPEPIAVVPPSIAIAPEPEPEPTQAPRWRAPAAMLAAAAAAAAAVLAVVGAGALHQAEPEPIALSTAPITSAPALASTVLPDAAPKPVSAPVEPVEPAPPPEAEGSRFGEAPIVLSSVLSGAPVWTTRFGFNSVEPAADAPLPALGACAQVQVVGMACGKGDPEANTLIAAGRAVATARLLVAAGVSPEALRLGVDMPEDASQAVRRRAEVRCITAPNTGEYR